VSSTDAAAVIAADRGMATLSGQTITNPDYLANASFSSGGPRPGTAR
jgi:hypothetical protein